MAGAAVEPWFVGKLGRDECRAILQASGAFDAPVAVCNGLTPR